MSLSHTEGERLFSRYACSPNELGYCGPEVADAFAEVASGHEVEFSLRPAASQFSGVWVYLVILGKLLGRDPLDAELVRGYWIGNELVDSVDLDAFWAELLAVISARAGSYWSHLNDSLRAEAAPTHAFHVLGVYPWTRLLSTGRPEPLEVLSSCCIRPGRVTAVSAAGVTVDAVDFAYTDGQLSLTEAQLVDAPAPFGDQLAIGDAVALHWGSVCDVLTEAEHDRLRAQLAGQLTLVNTRLAAERS